MARKPPPRRGQPRPAPVGYGHPPSKNRIKDKQVRNPWGRKGKPKPEVDFLDEEVTIRIEGVPCSLTRRKALEHFLFAKASHLNVRANEVLQARAEARRRSAAVSESTELTKEEAEAFDRYIEREARKIARDTVTRSDDPKSATGCKSSKPEARS